MGKLIYNTEELESITQETKERINKAIVAAAIRIRDDIRKSFLTDSKSLYKHHIGDISHLISGIMIGKDKGGSIKIHALGNKNDGDSYKTRFFVGGTKYRRQTKKTGQSIKPFTKGYIKATDSLNKVVDNSEHILNNFVKKAIDG